MNRDQILSELTPIFRDVFEDDALTPHLDMSAKDVPGWDSFANINIIVAVEQHFNVKFTTGEIEAFTRVGDMVALIINKINGQ